MIVSNGFAVNTSPLTTCCPWLFRIRRERKFTPLNAVASTFGMTGDDYARGLVMQT